MKRTCLLVILVAASLGLAQAPPAQKKPLDESQVLALLASGVPSQRIAALVDKRGISFEPTEDYLTTLKNVGADDVLLRTLRVTKRTKAAAVSAKVAAKREQAQEQSKEFRKAAMLARLAIEKHGDNYSTESETSYESYADEAKRACTIAEADVVTSTDTHVLILLTRYHSLAMLMRLQFYRLRTRLRLGGEGAIDNEANIKGLHERFLECGSVLGDILSGSKPASAGGSACETTGPWDKRVP